MARRRRTGVAAAAPVGELTAYWPSVQRRMRVRLTMKHEQRLTGCESVVRPLRAPLAAGAPTDPAVPEMVQAGLRRAPAARRL